MTSKEGKRHFGVGEGPYIVLPDGRWGCVDAKFPDMGSWPFDQLIESYVREMSWVISSASMTRYLVLFAADNNLFNSIIKGRVYQWAVPKELVDMCPVPYLFYNIKVGGNVFPMGARCPTPFLDKEDQIILRYQLGRGSPPMHPGHDTTSGFTTLDSKGSAATVYLTTNHPSTSVGASVAGVTIAVAGLFFAFDKKDYAAAI